MKPEPPKPLDYATPKAPPPPPDPLLLVMGILLLVIGCVLFFFGVSAAGYEIRKGRLGYSPIVIAIVGALLCWFGYALKSYRQPDDPA